MLYVLVPDDSAREVVVVDDDAMAAELAEPPSTPKRLGEGILGGIATAVAIAGLLAYEQYN